MRAAFLLPLALLTLSACAGQRPEPWQRPDGTLPTAAMTSNCHEEARRLAGSLYPDRPPNDARGRPRLEDDRSFPAEIRFYEQCMTRNGFARVK